MLIVYNRDGWYVVTLPDWKLASGPYATHDEAVQAIQTMAYRAAQGWAP